MLGRVSAARDGSSKVIDKTMRTMAPKNVGLIKSSMRGQGCEEWRAQI
jgi:hypothetical protein